MNDLIKNHLEFFDAHLSVIRRFFIEFDIEPQAKQSVRSAVKGGKIMHFTDPKKKKYLDELERQLEAKYQGPKICGHVRITIIFSFPWTKETSKYAGLKWVLMDKAPDLDNCQKPLTDILQKKCLKNDSQIVEVRMRKIRSDFICLGVMLDEVVVLREKIKNS